MSREWNNIQHVGGITTNIYDFMNDNFIISQHLIYRYLYHEDTLI